MARLITSGGEHRDHPTSDVGSPDGFAAGAALCVTDTTTYRSGSAAIKCPGTAANTSFRVFPFTAPASGQQVFARVYFRLSALPNATKKVAALVTSADGALVSARLTSGGVLQLWNDSAGAQIGSDTALVVEVGRWYRLQLRLTVAAGAADEAELLVKSDDYQAVDESVAATGLSVSDTHAARFRAGWPDAPGVTADMFLDDVAVNNSTGTDHNSWPNEGRVTVLVPKAAALAGPGSWTDCSGAASPWFGLDKQPPVGLADHTTAGHTGASAHQARVAVNTLQSMVLQLQHWATVGVLWPAGINPGSLTLAGVANTEFGQLASNTRREQSFVFGAAVSFDEIMLGLAKTGSPTDNIIVEVRDDSAGFPGGTVLASATVAGPSVPGIAAKMKVKLDQTVFPTPGVQYHVVLSRSGALDSANYYAWAKDSISGGTLNSKFPDYTPSVYNGTSWVQSGTEWGAGEHVVLITPSQGVHPPTYATQFVCHGEGATGVKAATVDSVVGGGVSVPQKGFNFGDNVGVAGTYPSNWRWAVGAGARPTPPAGAGSINPNITITKNSGSGTNACLCCAAGAIAEYAIPDPGWSRWQKTADSTFYWALRTVNSTSFELADGSVATVEAGDWAIYPEPQVDAGGDFPATLTSISTDALRSGYTLV